MARRTSAATNEAGLHSDAESSKETHLNGHHEHRERKHSVSSTCARDTAIEKAVQEILERLNVRLAAQVRESALGIMTSSSGQRGAQHPDSVAGLLDPDALTEPAR